MKKLLVVVLFANLIYASDNTSLLSRRRNISLALQSEQLFENQEEPLSDLEFFPSAERRQRSREISLLSEEILRCDSNEKYEKLCENIKKTFDRYSGYMDRVDFVEVDGARQTGREVLNNLLVATLREVGKNKGFSLCELDSFETFDGGRIKRLQRADLHIRSKNSGCASQSSHHQKISDQIPLNSSQVFSEGSDSE